MDNNSTNQKLWSELEELLGYTGKDGTYLHWLTRSKEGYSYNTVTIDDFVPVSEDDDLMNDLIEFINQKLTADRQAFKEQVLKEAELYSFTDVGPVDIAPSISIQDLKEILERIK